ncbi:DNA ligase [Paenibacillus allorhizosphaerae]|uniref:Multifunctional non-homologous end joining protein LigD n=1 Tax=Paenibacillus allorhizosphaerae TaxID=2849866 RepID=A0ABM8VN94_9BACL|nr:DNA ligase [Paenibacillus allorhizosphaerae]CAG7651185.1 Multifunctional non-homologous end joining protein LigD [Paenibacillus allorhizosphaerae]
MLNQPLSPMLLQPLSPSAIKIWPAAIKWDGFRILIHYDHGKVRAFSRHGTEVTARFPELNQIKLPVNTAILDGECIAFDLSQSQEPPVKIWWDDAMARFNTKKESAVKHISQTLKAHFPVWDILFLDNNPLLKKSFMERRAILSSIVPSSDVMTVTPLYEDGNSLFEKARSMGFEGICQYNPSSPYYLDQRPKDVIVKIKNYQYADCQIASIRKGEFGWGLMLNGSYVGVMEFPPAEEVRREFYKFSKKLIRGENKHWILLDPSITCRIKFQCYTKDGKLRSPKFEGFLQSLV